MPPRENPNQPFPRATSSLARAYRSDTHRAVAWGGADQPKETGEDVVARLAAAEEETAELRRLLAAAQVGFLTCRPHTHRPAWIRPARDVRLPNRRVRSRPKSKWDRVFAHRPVPVDSP